MAASAESKPMGPVRWELDRMLFALRGGGLFLMAVARAIDNFFLHR